MHVFSLIVAMDENQGIGYNNDLPWRLPNDLKHVKSITNGGTLVMGRKNYESIGRPLPNRRNIILTRNIDFTAEGCEVFHSVEEILEATKHDEVYIFGGEEIYRLFLPYVKTMFVTKLNHSFDVDTFFPVSNWDEWEEVSKQQGERNEKNPYDYYFYIYERKIVKS